MDSFGGIFSNKNGTKIKRGNIGPEERWRLLDRDRDIGVAPRFLRSGLGFEAGGIFEDAFFPIVSVGVRDHGFGNALLNGERARARLGHEFKLDIVAVWRDGTKEHLASATAKNLRGGGIDDGGADRRSGVFLGGSNKKQGRKEEQADETG